MFQANTRELKLIDDSIENKTLELLNEPPSSTGQSLPLVREWLNACQKFHQECHNQSGKFIPTRLIDLEGICPRLRLRSDLDKDHIQYATLSHCWGSSEKQIMKLTGSTFADYLLEIATEKLPKTFRDAVEICRKLDIRYLWIDSLCIIQDDIDDWAKESITMSSVYGGCMLCIAATSALDSSQGCLFERKYLPGCRISLKINKETDIKYECVNWFHPLADGNR